MHQVRAPGRRARDGRLWVIALWVIAITLALVAIKAALD
ncbi:unannotated protein [freshwater metagenome]|uniref:Unannotated protein n=1 Tax=freshwater metagenome TaxID=449393 RepID=A0A6J6VUQ8_9ZZZZ